MTYQEFCNKCDDLGIDKPTFTEYTGKIVPVYNYHPVFDGMDAEDKCVQMFAVGGLGIFAAMRDDADYGAALESDLLEALYKLEEAQKAYREAGERLARWALKTKKDWRCA